jgi:cell division protein FtsB
MPEEQATYEPTPEPEQPPMEALQEMEPEPEPEPEEVKPKPARRQSKAAQKKATRRAAYEKACRSMDMEFDEWIQTWDWQKPRMYCKLKRTAPQWVLGKQTGGTLDSKENDHFSEKEIQDRFGGGTYVIYVSGVDEETGRVRQMGNKQVKIAGDPKVVPTAEQAAQGGGPVTQQQTNSGVDGLAPAAQSTLVGMLDKQVSASMERMERQMSERSSHGAADPELLSLMQRGFEQQAEAARVAADKEAAVLRVQMEDLRQELSQLRVERDTYQHKVETEVTAARAEGERFVGQMLPTFAQQADQRARDAMQQAHDQVKRMQEQFARDLEMSRAHFSQQLENQKTLFQVAETNAQSVFSQQVATLQAEIGRLQARNEALESECRTLRDQVLNMHQEQAKKQDPMEQIQKAMAIKDFFAGDGEGGGSDNPLLNLASSFAPALGSALDIAKARMGLGGEGAPQMSPEQQQRLLMARQAQAQQAQQQVQAVALPQVAMPQAQAPTPRPTPKRRRPAPDASVRREDLKAGLDLLNQAISAGIPPEQAADAAANQIDRNTLRALCSRSPDTVIRSLHQAKLLEGVVASKPGLEYLAAFLQALDTRINPAPAQPAPQPQPEEGGDDNEA